MSNLVFDWDFRFCSALQFLLRYFRSYEQFSSRDECSSHERCPSCERRCSCEENEELRDARVRDTARAAAPNDLPSLAIIKWLRARDIFGRRMTYLPFFSQSLAGFRRRRSERQPWKHFTLNNDFWRAKVQEGSFSKHSRG